MKKKMYQKYLEKGMKFGRLTVLGVDEESKTGNTPNKWKYICKCDCTSGKTPSVMKYNLVGGHTQSCGCLAIERSNTACRKINDIRVDNDIVYISLFGKNKGEAIVDASDYDKLKDFAWRATSWGYAETRFPRSSPNGGTMITMQDMIMGNVNLQYLVDHRDNNKLNNKRNNLRKGTQALNKKNLLLKKCNSSGFKGVHIYKNLRTFPASIVSDHIIYRLGTYKTKELAAYAYDIASRILHKDWGKTNSDLGLLDHNTLDKTTRDMIESKVRAKLESKGVTIDYTQIKT